MIRGRGLAAARIPVNAPSGLPKNREVVLVADTDWDVPELLVNENVVELEPDKFSATPVKVPKALSNRPKTPVWVIGVGCNWLLKLKLTVAALALSARAVPATNTASDFMGFPTFGPLDCVT